MSYLTQMAGLHTTTLLPRPWVSRLAVAFIRGIARREMQTIGNLGRLVRAPLWVLLPFCIVGALLLVSQEWSRICNVRHGPVD